MNSKELIEYQNTHFRVAKKGDKIIIHKNFIPYLDRMNEIAKKHTMYIIVVDSIRYNLNVVGAIVPPAKMGNHLVGFALDCNLMDIETKEYYNSKKMSDGKGEDEELIQEIINKGGLRWGGNFKTKDVVHFDYQINLHNPKEWHRIYKELQKK